MAEKKQAKSSPKRTQKIVRDSTFARATIDRLVAINLGRDLELSGLQIGPLVEGIEDHGEQELLQLTPVVTEVVRLRLHWSSAIDAVMTILQQGSQLGKINKAELIKFIDESLDENADQTED